MFVDVVFVQIRGYDFHGGNSLGAEGITRSLDVRRFCIARARNQPVLVVTVTNDTYQYATWALL